uniref:Cysteine desulfurase, mitochondrial n=1 Tax=Lygus hesperus TaxID=30085 RepID=A0A0A9YRV4_LYGHE
MSRKKIMNLKVLQAWFYEECLLVIQEMSSFSMAPVIPVTPKLSIRRKEELLCAKTNQTNRLHAERSQLPQCIRRDTGIASLKGKSLQQAAMEWKKPVSSSSETLILPDRMEVL